MADILKSEKKLGRITHSKKKGKIGGWVHKQICQGVGIIEIKLIPAGSNKKSKLVVLVCGESRDNWHFLNKSFTSNGSTVAKNVSITGLLISKCEQYFLTAGCDCFLINLC